MIKFGQFILFFICFSYQGSLALADHQDPIAKTNINQQTDLFPKSVGDVKGFEWQIEGGKNNAVEGLKNSGNTIFEISGKREGEIQSEIGDLKNIKANDLGDRGAKAASESGIMEEIYIDENKTLYQEHKKDMELIANGTKDFLSNLLAKLKALGVDCKQVKGNKEIEPEYRIDIKKEESQDARYDPHFCEELRNKYHCKDELTVRCADLQFVAGALTNVAGNMRYTLDHNGYMTIGVNKTAYFYNDWGAQNDFIFNFNVSNAAGIESFKILQVDWADHVLIKLNDQVLFQSPGVNGKVEMSYRPEHYRIASDGERYYGVDVGTGDYITANTKRYHNAYPHAEGKQFLKDGNNVLHIRLAYGRGGKIWLALQFRERKCDSWQEIWSEECKQS